MNAQAKDIVRIESDGLRLQDERIEWEYIDYLRRKINTGQEQNIRIVGRDKHTIRLDARGIYVSNTLLDWDAVTQQRQAAESADPVSIRIEGYACGDAVFLREFSDLLSRYGFAHTREGERIDITGPGHAMRIDRSNALAEELGELATHADYIDVTLYRNGEEDLVIEMEPFCCDADGGLMP